jgi:pyruvate dehydrogenase E2 component (dihydrolipoamide acetyltransferase)
MTEGGIASFKKKVGDKVDPGDVLCEIETVRGTFAEGCLHFDTR